MFWGRLARPIWGTYGIVKKGSRISEYTRQIQWQSTQAHNVTIANGPNETGRDTARALKN